MGTYDIPEDSVLKLHLSYSPPSDGVHVWSGFAAAIRDARRATGRDVDTGAKIAEHRGMHGSWLGTIGYMTILDQIGTCFKPKKRDVLPGNSIVKALGYYTTLSQDEKDALYALRCAFAHDYSLCNINAKKIYLTHNFVIIPGGTGQIVTIPKSRWDGVYTHKNSDNQTRIDLEAFGDLVEGICNIIINLARNNELEIVLRGGAHELVSRYMVYQSVPPYGPA